MTPTHVVTIGGLALSGVDAHGSRWRLGDEDGRFARPPRRRTRQERSQADGSYPAGSLSQAHTYTLQGTVAATDAAAAVRSIDTAHAAVQDGRLTWTDPLLTRTQYVEVDMGPRFSWLSDRVLAWQVTLTAPDPTWYGPERVQSLTVDLAAPVDGWDWSAAWPDGWGAGRGDDGGSALVANTGTAVYWPRVRIDGPAENPRVSSPDTGGSVQVVVTLQAGQWLDIDARERSVLISGSLVSRHLTTWAGSGLAVAPGAAQRLTLVVDDPTDKPVMTVWSYEGAWL